MKAAAAQLDVMRTRTERDALTDAPCGVLHHTREDMADRHFFHTSYAACDQITDLYDFVWPTAVGMWNLRWQVAGYVSARPTASVDDLEGRFVGGSGVRGANLRRACVDKSWQTQQEQFARFLLIDLFAVFEGWLSATLDVIGCATRENEKDLQFPKSVGARGAKRGVFVALKRIQASESQLIVSALYPALAKHSKNSLPKINALLTGYRYFKEVRNAHIHSGGMAGALLIDAHQQFSKIVAPAELDMKEIPEHSVPALGKPITVSLRGVVGFSGILLRLIATLDAELARSAAAETVLAHRWKSINGTSTALPRLGSTQRKKRLRSLLRKLDLPYDIGVTEIETWALAHGFVN